MTNSDIFAMMKWLKEEMGYVLMGGLFYLVLSFLLSGPYFKYGLYKGDARYWYLFGISAIATFCLFFLYSVRKSSPRRFMKLFSLAGFFIMAPFFMWDGIALMWDMFLKEYFPYLPHDMIVFVLSWTTIGFLSGIFPQIASKSEVEKEGLITRFTNPKSNVPTYERNIEFILERFYEPTKKPVDSDWGIRILHPNRPIEKCIVLYNNTPLPWWDKDELYYERRFVLNGGGNVRVPKAIHNEGAEIRVLNGKETLRIEKFEELHIEK